jgi:hypothetical protein
MLSLRFTTAQSPSPPVVKLGFALLTLCGGCASSSNYFVDEQSRYHLELAPRMGVREGGGRVVAEHYDLDGTKISIDAVETEVADLDAYVATAFDPTAVKSGDRYDTTVGPLSATRLEFRGGIDLGAKLPVEANLVLYLILHESTVYRLSCTAPDGPFDTFCIGTFDDLVASFGVGPAPSGA